VDDFESFYRATRDGCFRALVATVRDAEEADDLLAEAYTRALSRWDSVRTTPAPMAWVMRTALNLHRDRWRRLVRARRLRWQSATASSSTVEADPKVLEALWALPERQRQVVALRVLAELNTSETAATLGIAPGTVTAHLHRGLAALRERLGVREEVL
jgi:RNA polymerase sigma factor (sigma-70 family)